MIVLDASVLIAHVESTDVHHERARRLLVTHRRHQFTASTITLADFLVGPARQGRLDAARHALDALAVEPSGIDGDAAVRLAELRASTALKLPDCCVLDVALRHPDSLLATFDEALEHQARRLRIRTAD